MPEYTTRGVGFRRLGAAAASGLPLPAGQRSGRLCGRHCADGYRTRTINLGLVMEVVVPSVSVEAAKNRTGQ